MSLTTGKPMLLYWGAGSPPCWRPLIVVQEKEVKECHLELLSFSQQEHKTDHMLRLNPRGELPTFYHGDRIVNESMAICDYLEKIFQKRGTRLLPDDEFQFAKVCQRKYEALNLFKRGNEDLVYWTWEAKPEEMTEEVMKKKKAALAEELAVWEKHLEKEAVATYIAGTEFSMADVIFFPTLAFLVRKGLILDATRFPRLRNYYILTRERPSIKATWPEHWLLTPDDTMLNDV